MAGSTPVAMASKSLGAHVASDPYGPVPSSPLALNLSALASAQATASPTAFFSPCATSSATCTAEAAVVCGITPWSPFSDAFEIYELMNFSVVRTRPHATYGRIILGARCIFFVLALLVLSRKGLQISGHPKIVMSIMSCSERSTCLGFVHCVLDA